VFSRLNAMGGPVMQTIGNGFRGFFLVIRLNSDALFTAGTVVVGLLAGAYLGTALFAL
jgi:hypothetical protein